MNTINLDNIVRSVMLISDTHVWSDYALVSRTPVYNKKRNHLNAPEALNPGQKTIQSYWYDNFIPVAKSSTLTQSFTLVTPYKVPTQRRGALAP